MDECKNKGVASTSSELIDLKEKISKLDTILSLLPGHVYWMDRDNIIMGCNENQARFAHLTRQEIQGKTHHEMIWKSQADEIEKLNRKIMEKGRPYIGEETVAMPNEGELTYLSHKVPLRDAKGQVVGLLGVSLDITDRKRIEKELKQAKEAAEIANQTKTEFIRNMEHDIRTPLCGIMNVVHYLESIEENTKKKEFLSDIKIATHELLNYLENIVEFSQINTGAVPIILREFDLQQVVQGILNLESAAAKDKRLDLQLDYPNDIPKMIVGDRFRVHRVLLNLISNAIKFTEQGRVIISVKVAHWSKADEVKLEIKVQDTGVGIAKKDREMIYEKFTRCVPSNQGLYRGTGLGLWIVKQFITDLKGKITLESEVGKGSEFTCFLPFKLNLIK